MPSLRNSRPTLTNDNETPNSQRITSRTISRVHNANSNCICRGSCPAISAYSRDNCPPPSFGGGRGPRPGLCRLPPALAVFRQPGVDRLAVQSERSGHILGMSAIGDLAHRPDPQRLKGLVIQLPAVNVPPGTILPDHKIKVGILPNSLVKNRQI